MEKKPSHKLLMIFLSIIIVLELCFSFNSVIATTINEIEKNTILQSIPDEMQLGIKEIEFEKAKDEVKEKLEKILGKKNIEVYFPVIINYTIPLEVDAVIFSEDRHDILAEKTIKISYSNSSQKNKEDENYILNLISSSDKVWEYKINEDGTFEKQEHEKSEWNEYFKNSCGIVDESIKYLETDKYITYDYELRMSCKVYTIFIFKDDIWYKGVTVKEYDMPRITIPQEIEETDEAYINYAVPILEKMHKGDKVQKIKRSVQAFEYDAENDIKFLYKMESGIIELVHIAKENEYRGRVEAYIKEINTREIDNESYLIVDLLVQERINYQNIAKDLGEYLPAVYMIDEDENRHQATVSKKSNRIYECKIKETDFDIEKIYVEATNTNNKSADKQMNIQLGKVVEINEYNLGNILEAIKPYTDIYLIEQNGNKKIDKEVFEKLQRTKKARLSIWISPYFSCYFKRRRYNQY